MPTLKTFQARNGDRTAEWLHFDADGVVLGRMAARIAQVLQGKHHAQYTPHVDTGDFVVVTNASKVVLTRNKAEQRMHRWHTGYIGGLKEMSAGEMRERHPERMIELAVRRMMPKTKLGRAMFKKLKVYSNTDHRHQAQQPASVDMTPFKSKEASA
ncbi:MAG: 50S ribosomal protein L13 [Planctomycetota bacterium]|nr:MAG: 50S ribosomal protein L13 [Planctomycetota bacterium]